MNQDNNNQEVQMPIQSGETNINTVDASPATEPVPVVPVSEPIPVTEPVPVTETVTTTPTQIISENAETPKVRYNPVTGEEMNMDELTGKVKKEEVPTTPETIPAEVVPVKKEKVVKEYKPPSAFKMFMLVLFLGGLIAFVVFLPEIQEYIAVYKAGPTMEEEITTGKLVCKLSTSTLNLDKDITRTFSYEDKKLKSAKFEIITRGDPTLDEDTLNEMNDTCTKISSYVDGTNGISVSCSYEEGKLTQRESFDYSSYDKEKVKSLYIEAGGNMLEFSLDEDIDQIMKTMRQGGFDCEKEK